LKCTNTKGSWSYIIIIKVLRHQSSIMISFFIETVVVRNTTIITSLLFKQQRICLFFFFSIFFFSLLLCIPFRFVHGMNRSRRNPVVFDRIKAHPNYHPYYYSIIPSDINHDGTKTYRNRMKKKPLPYHWMSSHRTNKRDDDDNIDVSSYMMSFSSNVL
jgi:hypothetical protein